MATTFLEPGGDATFTASAINGFWSSLSGTPQIVTDFVHGSHIKSIQYRPAQADWLQTPTGVLSNAGNRMSYYFYLVALPAATQPLIATLTTGGSLVINLQITSAGVLQLWNGITAQIGTNGATLSTGTWYRISIAWTITSTTVNEFRVYKDGVQTISVTNATITNIGPDRARTGNLNTDSSYDFRSSDHYIDNSPSLLDTGDIWVTAKRPNANGSLNNFTTQIGSGGSGYGSGHSPQVNERALSTTNGWSMVGAGSAVTEEYAIESKSSGDIDVSSGTIVDYLGWISSSSLVSETASIIVGGVSSNVSLTSTSTVFTAIAGSTLYPSGGTAIGLTTSTTVTTVSLYECGVVVAFIPRSSTSTSFIRKGVNIRTFY